MNILFAGAALVFCIIAPVVSSGEPTSATAPATRPSRPRGFPYREETPLRIAELGVSATAKLTALNPVLRPGEKLRLRLEFTNTGTPWRYYNFFLDPRVPSALSVTFYDPVDHRPLVTENFMHGISWLNPRPEDWVRLPKDGGLVKELEIGTPRESRSLVQVLFFRRFVEPPESTYPPIKLPPLSDADIFRSNAVFIERQPSTTREGKDDAN